MSLYTDHCGPIEREQRDHAARLRKALRNPPKPKPESPPPSAPVRQPDPPPPIPTPEEAVVVEAPTPRKVFVHEVINAAAEHFNITADDLIGQQRHLPLTRQRQIAMYVAYQGTSYSFPHIGRAFRHNHTTVHHAYWVIRERLDNGDYETGTAVKAIVEKLGLPWPCEREGLPGGIIQRPKLECADKRSSRWSSEDHSELIRLYRCGWPLRDIAVKLHRTQKSIETRVIEHGIASRRKKP